MMSIACPWCTRYRLRSARGKMFVHARCSHTSSTGIRFWVRGMGRATDRKSDGEGNVSKVRRGGQYIKSQMGRAMYQKSDGEGNASKVRWRGQCIKSQMRGGNAWKMRRGAGYRVRWWRGVVAPGLADARSGNVGVDSLHLVLFAQMCSLVMFVGTV